MDDSAGDALTTARPAVGGEPPSGLRAIVACEFSDALGGKYPGFIYWCEDGDDVISCGQPTLWCGKEMVSFWFGIQQPSREAIEATRRLLPPAAWPLRFESVALGGRPGIRGTLEGLSCLAGGAACCVRIS
jgi:hypothetical protein